MTLKRHIATVTLELVSWPGSRGFDIESVVKWAKWKTMDGDPDNAYHCRPEAITITDVSIVNEDC